ncbi:uncharacterized protein [Nicotiana tomentosiformis]|uniref:uncharacterized protein n=1 Tax=Nicotiana tomentosiformis TaxID=4098 RepID=UPI00388C85DF
MGLDPMNQCIAKIAADGSFMDKTFVRVIQILDKMVEYNQPWNSEDTTGEIAYGTPFLTKMIKEKQERDQMCNPWQMKNTKNQIMSTILKEDINDNPTKVQDNNINGGLTRKGKGQYSNSPHWKESSSSESKLENMLERVLQNHERSDTSTKNMTELVGSHTASIQKLEMQMRHLSRYQNPKQKGTLPSDTIANPKGSGSGPTSHCMAITTRSGKLLQGENEHVVKVEDSEQEVEAQVEVPIVVEVERLPKKVRTQEVNHEEVKEKIIEAPKNLAPIPRPPPPFPQRLAIKVDDNKLEKFYDILKQLSVNIPFVEAFQEMPGFAKYLKDLITKKKTTKNEVVNVTQRFSSIIATTAVQKKEDPGAFTIPCTIGVSDIS